ncbi:MAG: Rieske 2Fe-2S domain-containing protein [Bacteroidia bacterium]
MNFDFYTALAFSSQLEMNSSIQVVYQKTPVLIVRTAKGIFAYEDYCPHRGLALSQGKIINGEISCKYHGWTFDSESGNNTNIPVKQDKIDCQLKRFFVYEKYDLIWLSKSKEALLPELSEQKPQIFLQGNIRAQLANVLENFLEGSHTHYVHDGLIRTKEKKRNLIQAKIIKSENGFQVFYEHEPAKGFVTKILPKKWQQLKAVSTYIHPGIAVLEYFNTENKAVSRFEAIVNENENGVDYFARTFLDISWITPMLIPFAKQMFKKIIKQDKDILELQETNLVEFPEKRFVSDETDMVGKYIYAFQTGKNVELKSEVNFKVHW